MNEFIGYRNGVDLGGWLSQCGYEKEHIESFITEADIARIASWGCDHVRLPFDYNIILDENGGVLESGLKLLERCADWCGAHGLNIILDLHKTMGFSFDKGEQESGFFENQRYQDIFVNLWSRIAKRFGNRKDVAFEVERDNRAPFRGNMESHRRAHDNRNSQVRSGKFRAHRRHLSERHFRSDAA